MSNKATIIYGPPRASKRDDDDEVPYTKQDAKMTLEDLKTAVEKFNRKDQVIYAAQLEALNNPKNRRKALAARVPGPATKEMKSARENIINGLEMIDILEQIDTIDNMIGDLGILERQIQSRISKLIHQGCNVETLTGNPMKPLSTFRWEYGPLSPTESARLFSTECSEMAFLQEVMMRVVDLSDRAETEGTTWGSKLKNFNRRANFEDSSARKVFSSLGKLFEKEEEQDFEAADKQRRKGEINELQQQIEDLEQSTTFTKEDDSTLNELFITWNQWNKKRKSKAKEKKLKELDAEIKELEAMEKRFGQEQAELLKLRQELKKEKRFFNRRKK